MLGVKSRRSRCGICIPCNTPRCETCKFCLDNKGPKKLKQACKMRHCLQFQNKLITHLPLQHHMLPEHYLTPEQQFFRLQRMQRARCPEIYRTSYNIDQRTISWNGHDMQCKQELTQQPARYMDMNQVAELPVGRQTNVMQRRQQPVMQNSLQQDRACRPDRAYRLVNSRSLHGPPQYESTMSHMAFTGIHYGDQINFFNRSLQMAYSGTDMEINGSPTETLAHLAPNSLRSGDLLRMRSSFRQSPSQYMPQYDSLGQPNRTLPQYDNPRHPKRTLPENVYTPRESFPVFRPKTKLAQPLQSPYNNSGMLSYHLANQNAKKTWQVGLEMPLRKCGIMETKTNYNNMVADRKRNRSET